MKNYRHRIVAILIIIAMICIFIEIYKWIFIHIPIVFAVLSGVFIGGFALVILTVLYIYASAQDEELYKNKDPWK
jgi:hypothetical protein